MVFRLVGHDRGHPPHAMGRRKQYPNALRKAVQEILGSGPEEVRIFRGERLVAVCERQYRHTGKRGGKFSVVCSGEKPTKRKR